jgi:hypothetical protein
MGSHGRDNLTRTLLREVIRREIEANLITPRKVRMLMMA